MRSGCGLAADKLIRQMAVEYTHRYASSGIYSQPISFNYIEPFLHIKLIDQTAPYAEIEEEFNHLFYPLDFFDFVTLPSNDNFLISSLLLLPEDKIYHFSINGEVTDITFLNGAQREFAVAAFSMVRRRGSLHWYLLGGEQLSEEEWKERSNDQREFDIASINPDKKAFIEESIEGRGSTLGPPLPLEGTKYHVRTVVAGEFDLGEKKHLSRCCMTEYKNTFDVVCDDPEIFAGFTDREKVEQVLVNMNERFNRCNVLWSLAESFFQLPRYFEARVALNYSDFKISRKKIQSKKGGAGLRSNYSVVSALERSGSQKTSAIISIRLPHYEVETEGHWKVIGKEEFGEDRHGNSILGRTWVSSATKWKHKHEKNPIFVKDTIQSAKLKLEEYQEAVNSSQVPGQENMDDRVDVGELYVMRCPAMKDTIFKVGFTKGKSEDRAKQLSSATGVPLAFVVVKSWRHVEARKLEKEVQMMLAPYQVNNAREFYHATYEKIESIIERIIRSTEDDKES